jgi:heptosyltransferase-3
MNIAISRTDHIGDVIMTMPMCGIIKKNFKDCNLFFIGSTYTKDIISCNKDVDTFIDYNHILSLNEEDKIQYIKSLNLDIIVFAFPCKELARLMKKSKVKTRIATSHRLYNWLYCNSLVNFSRKNSNLNEAQLNTFLLKPLKLFKSYSLKDLYSFINLKIQPTDSTYKDLLSKEKFNLIIHPKSNKSAVEWSMDNYNELIELLNPNIQVFVCGTKKEGLEIEIKDKNVINLTGKLTLKEYIEFISLCDGLLACSTGPLHIAAITNINSIGLFPPNKPINPTRWHPLGNNVKIFCDNMQNITPKQVSQYLNSLSKIH